MWVCPRCGQRFQNRNQWHACGNFTVEGFLAGKNPEGVALFHRFVDELRKLGPFDVSPAKTRVAFNARMRFAAINSVGIGRITGHLIIRPAQPGAPIRRIDDGLVHHFTIRSMDEFNDAFRALLARAYETGGGPAIPPLPGPDE